MNNRLPISEVWPSSRSLWVGGLVFLAAILSGGTLRAQQELPQSLHGLFEAGVAAEREGRLDEAAKDFQQILRQGGKVASVYSNLGIVYQMKGDHLRAITQFREAIRMRSDFLAPHILLGASLLAIDKVPEAVREFERALEIDPKQSSVRVQLAKAYERENNFAAMLDQYRALRDLAPQDPEFAYLAGQAYLLVAAWCLEQMQRLDPQSPRVLESQADAYRAQGQNAVAIRLFQKAAAENPNLPGIHLALAQIYFEQSKMEDARHEIELELAIVPENSAAKAIQQKLNSATLNP
jgi:Flp pilus assembly protein TadD